MLLSLRCDVDRWSADHGDDHRRPNTSGTQYTLLSITSGNFPLVAKGIRSGDVLRFGFSTDLWGDVAYDSYVVDRVLNESTLVLKTGSQFAESIPRRIEIYRTFTVAERALAMANQLTVGSGDNLSVVGTNIVSRYPNRRIRFLPFGQVYDGANLVPAYHMALT